MPMAGRLAPRYISIDNMRSIMTQLTPSAIRKVQDALSSSSFALADFNIHLPESGSCLLHIDFRHRDGYEFRVIETKQKSKVKTSVGMGSFGPTREEVSEYTALFTRETPGSFKMQDQIESSYRDSLFL